MLNKARLYSKATLYTMGKSKEARLLLNDYNGYLRFSVFVRDIGNPNAKASLAANIPIRRDVIFMLLDELKSLKDKEDNYSFTAETYSPIWENDKPTNNMKPNGKVVIGKRKVENDSINYIAIIPAGGDKKFVFKFLPTPYVKLYRNGKILSDTEASEIWTKGWVKTVEGILDLYPDIFEEKTDLKELDKSTKPVTQNAKSEKKEDISTELEIDDIDELI